MNKKQKAERILGIMPEATIDDISKKFQDKVIELVQKQLTPDEFHKQLTTLYIAHDDLIKYMVSDSTKAMINNFFGDNINESIQTKRPQYRYTRAYSKSLNIDKDGNVIGSTNKIIQDNDKIFKEEKRIDSLSNNVHIKWHKPDGSIKEFDRPYGKKMLK